MTTRDPSSGFRATLSHLSWNPSQLIFVSEQSPFKSLPHFVNQITWGLFILLYKRLLSFLTICQPLGKCSVRWQLEQKWDTIPCGIKSFVLWKALFVRVPNLTKICQKYRGPSLSWTAWQTTFFFGHVGFLQWFLFLVGMEWLGMCGCWKTPDQNTKKCYTPVQHFRLSVSWT